jgi:hypothetical protein
LVLFGLTSVEYEGWHEQNFNIEYKPIEKHKYTVVARLKFDSQYESGDSILRLFNDSDPYFKNFCRIRIYKLPATLGQLEKDNFEEGVLVKSNEIVFAAKEYFRFNYGPQERYLVSCPNPDFDRFLRRA